jgi:hypothetical protein
MTAAAAMNSGLPSFVGIEDVVPTHINDQRCGRDAEPAIELLRRD